MVVFPRGGKTIRVGVAFPQPLPVAASNLGYQTVFALLSSFPGLTVEQVVPGDRHHPPSRRGRFLATIQNRLPLKDLDLLAISIPYENDYPQVLKLLSEGGIPIRAHDRKKSDPVILAGGVTVTLNPEPLAEIVDIIAIGEAETILPNLIPLIKTWSENKKSRKSLLEQAAGIEGIYVPLIHRPDTNSLPTVRIQRQRFSFLDSRPAQSVFFSPEAPLGDRFLIEVARGCVRRCRFCTVQPVYQPVRSRSLENLIAFLPSPETINRIGLVGASLSDLPVFPYFLKYLVDNGYQVSTSSLRIESLTTEILATLREGGARTLTIAPETASDRLREIIGKPTPDADLFRVAEEAVALGYKTLKIYLMIGLPGEEEPEIQANIDLIRALREKIVPLEASRGEPFTLSVSVSPLVPKPWTPFQWEAMPPRRLLDEKIAVMQRGVRSIKGVVMTSNLPKWAEVEGYLSRGDRKLTPLLESIAGGQSWPRALKEFASALPPIHQPWDLTSPLPWEIVDLGIPREKLASEALKIRAAVKSVGG